MRRLFAIGLLAATAAYAAGAKTYPSPEEAVRALVAAARAGDADAILVVLGSDAKEIVRTGDAATDRQARERFVAAYAQANKIAKPNDKLWLPLTQFTRSDISKPFLVNPAMVLSPPLKKPETLSL